MSYNNNGNYRGGNSNNNNNNNNHRKRKKSSGACRQFNSPNGCSYGDNCRFTHGGNDATQPVQPRVARTVDSYGQPREWDNSQFQNQQQQQQRQPQAQQRQPQAQQRQPQAQQVQQYQQQQQQQHISLNTGPSSTFQGFARQQQAQQVQQYSNTAAPNVQSRTTSTTLSQITQERFADLKQLHPSTLRALTNDFKYEFMTKVQAQSVPTCISGKDVVAKAKTGTGKTISFLLPAINAVAAVPVHERTKKISVLIISPTRELAEQIKDEAAILVKYHKSISVGSIVGGIKINKDFSMFSRNMPDILVATPGRLNDHLENHTLAQAMSNLKALIFDEADQLLDMGFRPAIEKCLRMLPSKDTRQTLLFSATMPNDVQGIAKIAMKTGGQYAYIDTVGKEESTHQHVPQFVSVTTMEQQTDELINVVLEGMKTPGYKILAFFTTARLTQFYAELFNLMGLKTLEIHSRKSQSVRKKTSEKFRVGNGLVMFSSDVTARGMDYPDVTKVIQFGRPSDRAQYIHRLGRTARAGKKGDGVLILADFEKSFIRELKDLPLQTRTYVKSNVGEQEVKKALAQLPQKTFVTAYQAWMGFYNSYLKKMRWTKQTLVDNANHWICNVMFYGPNPPGLMAKTVGKMGLKGVSGIVIDRTPRQGQGGGRGGGGRGGGRSGGGGGRGGGRSGGGARSGGGGGGRTHQRY